MIRMKIREKKEEEWAMGAMMAFMVDFDINIHIP